MGSFSSLKWSWALPSRLPSPFYISPRTTALWATLMPTCCPPSLCTAVTLLSSLSSTSSVTERSPQNNKHLPRPPPRQPRPPASASRKSKSHLIYRPPPYSFLWYMLPPRGRFLYGNKHDDLL